MALTVCQSGEELQKTVDLRYKENLQTIIAICMIWQLHNIALEVAVFTARDLDLDKTSTESTRILKPKD